MHTIGEDRLTLEAIAHVARAGGKVRLGDAARARIDAARRVVDRIQDGGDAAPAVYGVNTGFGFLADVRISADEIRNLQRNLIRSHAAGVGEPLSVPVVRAMMLLRAQVLALVDAEDAARLADLIGAMSLEALKGTPRAFDARIHAVRPHPGQAASARNLSRLLADSGIVASHRNCGKVQDAYSLRCMPQVH